MQPLSQNRSCRAARHKEVKIAGMQLLFSACLHWPRVLSEVQLKPQRPRAVSHTYLHHACCTVSPLFSWLLLLELLYCTISAFRLLFFNITPPSFTNSKWLQLLQSRVKLSLYMHHGWPKGENSDEHLSWLRTHLKNLQTRCTKSLVDLLQRILGGQLLQKPCCCACDQNLLLGMHDPCIARLLNKLLVSSDLNTTADLANNCILGAKLLSAAPLP